MRSHRESSACFWTDVHVFLCVRTCLCCCIATCLHFSREPHPTFSFYVLFTLSPYHAHPALQVPNLTNSPAGHATSAHLTSEEFRPLSFINPPNQITLTNRQHKHAFQTGALFVKALPCAVCCGGISSTEIWQWLLCMTTKTQTATICTAFANQDSVTWLLLLVLSVSCPLSPYFVAAFKFTFLIILHFQKHCPFPHCCSAPFYLGCAFLLIIQSLKVLDSLLVLYLGF